MDDHGAEVEVAEHRRTPPNRSARPPRIAASPAARAAADRLDVELHAVTGTGPRGRVVLADVRRVAAIPTASRMAAPAAAVAPPRPALGADDLPVRPTAAQLAVARRTLRGQTSPLAVVERDADVSAVLHQGRQLTALGLGAPSLDDVVVKAAALALRLHPGLNSAWQGGTIVERGNVHVGIGVAGPRGLLVPVIRDADTLPLARLAWVVGELARQARRGVLRPAARRDATFTVSTSALLGANALLAGLATPGSAGLAVGALHEAGTLRLRLTYDRRVVDEPEAVAFLADLAGLVAVPLALAS